MVALLALALQFASNFGHFHREWIGQPEASHAETAADHAGHDHDDDHHNRRTPHRCPICIAASFAQSFTPALPPALPALIVRAATAPAPASETPATHHRRGPFQSRAPPLA